MRKRPRGARNESLHGRFSWRKKTRNVRRFSSSRWMLALWWREGVGSLPGVLPPRCVLLPSSRVRNFERRRDRSNMNDLGDPKWMRYAQMFDRSRDAGECVIASWRRKGALRWLLNVCRKRNKKCKVWKFYSKRDGSGALRNGAKIFLARLQAGKAVPSYLTHQPLMTGCTCGLS